MQVGALPRWAVTHRRSEQEGMTRAQNGIESGKSRLVSSFGLICTDNMLRTWQVGCSLREVSLEEEDAFALP